MTTIVLALGASLAVAVLAGRTIAQGSGSRQQERTRRLHAALYRAPRAMSGYELARAARVHCGWVYADLARMEADGTVVSHWGEPDRKGHRRRFYRLTKQGQGQW